MTSDVICPHCGALRNPMASTPAWVCPACGRKYYEPVAGGSGGIAMAHQSRWPKASLKQWMMAGGFLLLLLPALAIVIPYFGAPREAPQASAERPLISPFELDRAGVHLSCSRAVRQMLIAPGTAKIQLDVYVYSGSGTANGYVDAQNAFGVPLRHNIHCEAQKTGDAWVARAEIRRPGV